jgi:regulator of chromosome condensation
MSVVMIYGSGECDQLGLGDEGPPEAKKPRRLAMFDVGLAARKVVKIGCGGMHSLALTNEGELFSWGCNDDKALGRLGAENEPLKVELPIPVSDFTCGDCHSIAYSTSANAMYLWGLYRNSVSGKVFDPVELPQRFGQETFTKANPIEKIVSGQHHTLAMSKGSVYAWGDAECGKIGRASQTRRKNEEAMRIMKLGCRAAIDIFCGKNTSFYMNKKY